MRKGIKFTIIFILATFLIVSVVAFLYKPIYSVYINGKEIGYTENKTELQHKINDYIENGEGKDNTGHKRQYI